MINVIRENALFIADSHYPHHGNEFLDLLKKIDTNEIHTPQLFLMGDNFDLLFGYNDYILTFSAEAIKVLRKLSQKLEIHYFEGNHDFCLKELFPNIKIYSRDQQPIQFILHDKKVAISHGDKYDTGFIYEIFSRILRSKTTLSFLKPWEKAIIDDRMKKLSQKNICHTFYNFENKVESILEHYKEVDLVIEGHFHQSKVFGKYISLPSLVCQGKVAVIENGNIVFKVL